MNRYEIKIPRVAVGVAAVAMAVLTLGVAVIVPAQMASGGPEVLAESKVVAPTEVAIIPSHIEVVGIRPQTVALESKPSRMEMVSARVQELVAVGGDRAASR